MTKEENQETKILTKEEKQNFDGITIDEENGRTEESARQEEFSPFSDYMFEEGKPRQSRIKVITFGKLSWKTKLLIGIVVTVVLAAIIFIGGFILMGIFGLLLLGALISLLRKLF